MALPTNADAVVIGSGFAGCSAAVRLAEAGRRVVLVEEAPRLGGRATSFIDRETGERVDNGQHALFGCYRETYDFLGRIGSASLAPLQSPLTLTMASVDGARTELRCPRLPAPWHLLAGLIRWPAISSASRLRALRLARAIRGLAKAGEARFEARVPATLTVSDWLDALDQPADIRQWLWYPLAIAALNQQPHQASARPFVRVLIEMFAPDPDASSVGLPIVPLDDLFATPTATFIEARGGCVITRTRARVVVSTSGPGPGSATGVRVGESLIAAPIVVSSVPWFGFGRLWDGAAPPEVQAIADHAGQTGNSPIVTVNLWLDSLPGKWLPSSFAGLIGGPMHWVFDKSSIFLGDGTSHLSIVSSGASEIVNYDNQALTAMAFDQLVRTFPILRERSLQRSVVVREPRATFSVSPGAPPRPGATTAIPGFFLAGDWTDTGLPGTIEGAVRSGYRAASAALQSVA